MERRNVARLVFLSVAVIAAIALGVERRLDAHWPQGGAQGAQAAPRAAPAPPLTPRAAAPIDLTGYWVSVVSEDWRLRMVPPGKGDYANLPITREAETIADAWDPLKDAAEADQCKSFGAPAIMRVPTRLHITWQDDTTLKVEIDAGTQTRLFHFGGWKAPAGAPTWQGNSVAQWETPAPGRGAAPAPPGASVPKFGNLKVATTHLKPGYIRKNGVPYSENTTMTEYWDLNTEENGERWLIITSIVRDPRFLRMDYITSPNFKKEPDGSKWDPSPCSASW